MTTATKALTPLELEIMHIVWEASEVSVRDVYQTLLARRPIAYTTVMTMMTVLTDKGHLRRRQQARAYLYQPATPKAATLSRMVRDFVDRVFEGSAGALLVHLLDSKQVDHAEVDTLRRQLDAHQGGQEEATEEGKEKEKEKGKDSAGKVIGVNDRSGGGSSAGGRAKARDRQRDGGRAKDRKDDTQRRAGGTTAAARKKGARS